MSIDLSNAKYPQALTVLRNWVCWRLEQDKKSSRDVKVPYNPSTTHKASIADSNTWGTLAVALEAQAKYMFSGIGVVITAESGIIVIDLDKCLTNGQLNETAAAILAKVPPTYIEISPSGTGLHIFLFGTMPKGGNRNTENGVEMYSNKRYITVTGNRWRDCTDEIAVDNGCLQWIFDTFIKRHTTSKSRKQPDNQENSTLTDDALLELARSSKDGAAFENLWRGEWQGKYKSQSEVDFALCCKLAFWSNHDSAQMDRLFRQSGLFRDKWDTKHSAEGDTYGVTTLKNACMKTPDTYKPKRKRQISVYEQGGVYYRKRGETVGQLTNFIVKPIELIMSTDETQLTCDFITDNGETYRLSIMASDFTSIQKFRKVLNQKTIALCFFGTEGDLDPFKQYLHSMEWKHKKGVKALGIYNHDKKLVFVSTSGAMGVGGKPVDTIIQLERYKSIESDIINKPILNPDELKLLGSMLLTYNEPAKTAPILAWMAGCFIKPHLKRNIAKYPHLFLIGEPGSGKSNTLENIITQVFCIPKITSSSQVYTFALLKDASSSNVIPQALNEFKPSRMKKTQVDILHNHFRDCYDWHEGIRGRADQTLVTYDLLAPLVVAGEESADEAAIRERTITLVFSKIDIEDTDYEGVFASLSKQRELLGAFGRTLLDTALRTTPKEVNGWYEEGKERIKERFPSRITSNLSCVYAGLKLVEKTCGQFNLSWNGVFPLELEACANQLVYAAKEYLLGGGTHNLSLVEQAFEVMARMGLKAGKDFKFDCAGRHLCLHLKGIYDRYTRYRRDYAVLGEVLRYGDFKQQLKKSAYYIEDQRVVRFGSVTHKAWVLDFQRLSGVCEVSGFLEAEADKGD